MNVTGSSSRQRVSCPECHADIVVEERMMVGEDLTCDRCRTPLEVLDLVPLRIGRRVRIEEEAEDFSSWPAI